jgi:hypothetical protein
VKSIVDTYIRIKMDMMVEQVGRFIYVGNGTNSEGDIGGEISRQIQNSSKCFQL